MIYLVSVTVFLCYVLNGAQAASNENNITILNENGEAANLTSYCKDKPCLPKCCKKDEIIILNDNQSSTCSEVSNDLKTALTAKNIIIDYSDLAFYKLDNLTEALSTKKFPVDFKMLQITNLIQENCFEMSRNGNEMHMLENGDAVMFENKTLKTFYNQSDIEQQPFCVDHRVTKTGENNTYVFCIKNVLPEVNTTGSGNTTSENNGASQGLASQGTQIFRITISMITICLFSVVNF